MKHVLNGNLKLWHLVAFAVVLLLFSGGAVALAGPDGVNGFFGQGTIRLASAYDTAGKTIHGSNNPPVKVLSVSITIPDGKKADLQTSFSADMHHGIAGPPYVAYCFGYFTLDANTTDAAFRPGGGAAPNYMYQLLGGQQGVEPDAITVGMVGFRKNVPAGNHTVNVYISSAYAGCDIQYSNLNVIANIR